jgi:hypothetical protein
MTTTMNNWDAFTASFQEDGWTKIMCGCPDCLETKLCYDMNDSRNHLTKYTCKKLKEYNDSLPNRNHYRAINQLKPTAFKAASKSQIEEWASWGSSPTAVEAEKGLATERNKYKNHKFISADMEKELAACWPNQRLLLLNTVKWNLYEKYTNEQKMLLKNYDNTEIAHKKLIEHINAHGQLIEEVPTYENKKLGQASNFPKKLGRRAARHAREEIPVEKTYTRAELRDIVRASENTEVVAKEE